VEDFANGDGCLAGNGRCWGGGIAGAQQGGDRRAPRPPPWRCAVLRGVGCRKVFVSNAGGIAGLFTASVQGTPAGGAYIRVLYGFAGGVDTSWFRNRREADWFSSALMAARNGPAKRQTSKGGVDPLPMFVVVYDRAEGITCCEAATESATRDCKRDA